MECCLAGVARRSCEGCRASASCCKSVSTARLRSVTICIVDQALGREREKAFSARVLKDFACDWRRLLRLMRRLKSFVDFLMRRRLLRKIESYGGLRCAVRPMKVSPLRGLIWCRK